MNIRNVTTADQSGIPAGAGGGLAYRHKLALQAIASILREYSGPFEVSDIRKWDEWHEARERHPRSALITYMYGEPVSTLQVMAFERMEVIRIEVIKRGDLVTFKPAVYRLTFKAVLGNDRDFNHMAHLYFGAIDVSINLRRTSDAVSARQSVMPSTSTVL